MYVFVGYDKVNKGVVLVNLDNLNSAGVPSEQFKVILSKNEIVNVGVKEGKLVGLNGSLNNYGVVGEKNVPVIIKVGTKRKRGRDEVFEYVISTTDGKVVKYGKDKAIELFKKLGVANGRLVVQKDGKAYVSAIRGSYQSYELGVKDTKKRCDNNDIVIYFDNLYGLKDDLDGSVEHYTQIYENYHNNSVNGKSMCRFLDYLNECCSDERLRLNIECNEEGLTKIIKLLNEYPVGDYSFAEYDYSDCIIDYRDDNYCKIEKGVKPSNGGIKGVVLKDNRYLLTLNYDVCVADDSSILYNAILKQGGA